MREEGRIAALTNCTICCICGLSTDAIAFQSRWCRIEVKVSKKNRLKSALKRVFVTLEAAEIIKRTLEDMCGVVA